MKLESTRKKQDLSIITFVHGWKHNAKESDTNVQAFQSLLEAVTAAELQPSDTSSIRSVRRRPPMRRCKAQFWSR
jgi:hypothetical protein